MFEPELFGFSSSQYQQAAASLVTAALGFLFLYALGLPLKKIPFIDAIEDYRPPAWLLPLFALGSTFILTLSLSVSIFLNVFRAYPSDQQFAKQFIKERPFEIGADLGQLQSANLELVDFDGLSNFGIYVNGYRALGSASDCLLGYQCRPTDTTAADEFKAVNQLGIKDKSIHHVHSMKSLPFTTEILDHLVKGDNFVDVVSGNSGVGDCRLAATISLSFSQATLNYKVIISPEQGQESLQKDQSGVVNTFFAGGQPPKPNQDPPKYIDPYSTLWTEGTDRLCERIRIRINLAQEPLTRQMREHLVFAEHRTAFCEILSDGRPYCEKASGK